MRIMVWISDGCSSDVEGARRGEGKARSAGRQGSRQRVEEDQFPGRGRGHRQQAGQSRGTRHRDLGRGQAAGFPRRTRMSACGCRKQCCHGSEPMSDWQPSATFDARRLRARLNAAVREFLAQRGVLEVETPVMSQAGNTEPNIASFELEFSGRTDGGPRTRWLRTSPEHPLKRLLAAGLGDCYELGRVFRDGEAGGRHNPEFTMPRSEEHTSALQSLMSTSY